MTILPARRPGTIAALAADGLIAGNQIAEIVLPNDDMLISWTPALYLAIGLTIAGLAALVWLARDRRSPRRPDHPSPI